MNLKFKKALWSNGKHIHVAVISLSPMSIISILTLLECSIYTGLKCLSSAVVNEARTAFVAQTIVDSREQRSKYAYEHLSNR